MKIIDDVLNIIETLVLDIFFPICGYMLLSFFIIGIYVGIFQCLGEFSVTNIIIFVGGMVFSCGILFFIEHGFGGYYKVYE